MIDMDAGSWQMNVEELLALQSILQSSLVCFVDGIQRVIDDATAEQLMEEGCRGRQLSCTANIHPCMPDGDLTVQVRECTFCQLLLNCWVFCFLLTFWRLLRPGEGFDGR